MVPNPRQRDDGEQTPPVAEYGVRHRQHGRLEAHAHIEEHQRDIQRLRTGADGIGPDRSGMM